jgi:uncharacterized cupin superfamily protein
VEVYNINDLHHEQLISSKTGEIFSKSAVLTELFFCHKIFVHHEILSPMKRASAPHSHTIQEEMILVLDGLPTAHLGNQVIQLKPGDFIGFKPGTKELHYIENTTDKEVRFLVICSNQEDDKIVFDS